MATGGRASVRQFTLDDLRDILDLRIALEPTLAVTIVEEARGRDIAELRRLSDEMATTQTTTAWLRLNYDFHLKLYDLAGRPHARRICANLLALTQP